MYSVFGMVCFVFVFGVWDRVSCICIWCLGWCVLYFYWHIFGAKFDRFFLSMVYLFSPASLEQSVVTYLIFVTGITGGACGEFFCYVEKFLHMKDCHVEKYEENL